MGDPERGGGSNVAMGIVVVLIAGVVLVIPCIGALLLVGIFSVRAVSVPAPMAPPPVTVAPMPAPLPPVTPPPLAPPVLPLAPPAEFAPEPDK